MAKVGAQRAAELTGVSKSTVQRAMKTGKLSYEVDKAGRRVIDVAELERAFGLVPQDTAIRNSAVVEAELEKATAMLETERLKMRIRMLEDQLDRAQDQVDDLKIQRDQWQKQAQQVLLTSQYSQKQAEELQAELKERDRRAEQRRQQMAEQQRRRQAQGTRIAMAPATGNENHKTGPLAQQRQGGALRNFDIQGLWKKVRGQNEGQNEVRTAGGADVAATTPAETGDTGHHRPVNVPADIVGGADIAGEDIGGAGKDAAADRRVAS